MSGFDVKTLTEVVDRKLTMPRVRLEVIAGPSTGASKEFEGTLRIGSRDLADFVIADPKISGLHCELTAQRSVHVKDLGSKNGTFMAGCQIFDALLPYGHELALGDTRLRVQSLGTLTEIPLSSGASFQEVVGRSPVMRALMAKLERLAQVDATVLIEGETGTGKERVAEALHTGGPRHAGPLVVVDCGSLPSQLIESELFGHERGAFTGAVERKVGAFEQAHGGTIFLDEIGELPLDLQPKLLRAIESRKVRRVGGDKQIAVDVRIVAATNRDLAVEAAKGRFREDLYYRLAVVKLQVPALRDRREDLPLLAYALLGTMVTDPLQLLTQELMTSLESYHWPGNVRELRNALERHAALGEPLAYERVASTDAERAAPASVAALASIDVKQPLRTAKQNLVQEFERAYIEQQLAACGGNVSECARRSGMDRMSIHRIIQRLGLRSDPK